MEKFFEPQELVMAEMKHLHLFPTEFPKDQAMIVLNKIRGVPDGKSNRDVIEAAWWCGGYAASMIPDTHPVEGVKFDPDAVGLTDEQLTTQLQSMLNQEDGMKGLIPWERIADRLFELAKQWFWEWLNNQ